MQCAARGLLSATEAAHRLLMRPMRVPTNGSEIRAALRSLLTAVGLALAASAGCSDSLTEGEQSVCPTCGPAAGGETGDFGGFPTPCGYVSTYAPIEREQASALGFDVAAVERQLSRSFDEPLSWERPHSTSARCEAEAGTRREGDAGIVWEPSAVRGYEASTRVSGTVRVASTALRHYRPDPAYCDGTTCRRDPYEGARPSILSNVPQATCPDGLELEIEVEVRTADGAVRATAKGRATKYRSPNERGELTANSGVSVDAYTPLREVKGTLRIDPPEELAAHGPEFRIWFNVEPDRVVGGLEPMYRPPATPLETTLDLWGRFPPRPLNVTCVNWRGGIAP